MHGDQDAATSRRLARSYDVFDTLITRLLYRPCDVLELVGVRLQQAGLLADTRNWTATRMGVETTTRLDRPGRETTLPVIYRALQAHFGWTDEASARALEIELATEAEMVRAVGRTVQEYRSAREAGERCLLVSDTYFDSAQLSRLLARAGVEPHPQDILVSCEHGASKGYGTLFPLVKQRLGDLPLACHTGDNPKSDGSRAAAAGIPTRLLVSTRATRYEQELASASIGRTDLLNAALAGAARVARLASVKPENCAAFWDAGANVMGPLLAAFILEVLLDARRRGLRRLYFVARDGWIMMRIAETLLPLVGSGIELRYLHGSRHAWHHASIGRNALDTPPSWLTENLPTTSLRAFLSRLDLSVEECAGLCASAGLTVDMPDLPMGANAANGISALLRNPDFQRMALEKTAASRSLARDYLSAQGIAPNDASWALVDIGWQGRMQLSLGELLDQQPGIPMRGYYLGLSPRARNSATHEFWSYLPQGMHASSVALHAHRTLAELMCTAPHGTTLGYRRDGGTVVPVMGENPEAADPRLDAQREAIQLFAREMVEAVNATGHTPELVAERLRPAVCVNWQRFVHKPSLAEASAYGALTHHHEQGKGRDSAFDHEVAPRLATGKLLAGLALPPQALAEITWWGEASAIRSLPVPAAMVLQYLYRMRATVLQAAATWKARRAPALSR